MIYGVFHSDYSDWYPIGYFNNREDADKYCCAYKGMYIVKAMKNLSDEKDLSSISLKYTHYIHFSKRDINKWAMNEVNDRYDCYISDELRCNNIGWRKNSWVNFAINIDHYDIKLAEKIAQDYFAELRSYGDGEICQRNIDLMNEKFAAPFKERERIKKEEETKQKELAELARLKEKYESN